MSPVPPVQNSFAVDYGAGEHVIDINNPPRRNYNPGAPENQFPKMVYHHDDGHVLTVADERQLKAALKRGFKEKPDPRRDYSQVKNTVAPIAASGPLREAELSAEVFASEDEQENS